MIKRNILANVIGGGLNVLLNLLIIPLQVRILGPEAFGILGFIASLQVIFSILDFGLSTTLIRELARDMSPGWRESTALIRTLSTIYWLGGLLLGIGLFISADYLAIKWLNLHTLSSEQARLAIQILALYVALRWPVTLYGGIITGVEALVSFNVLKALNAVVRLVGGFAVLLISRELHTFLLWLVISALIEVISYISISRQLLPQISMRPGFSMSELQRIWEFSLSMNVISILAVVFTQADRVFLSRLVSLEELGYYSIAMTVVMSISVIQGFITSAVMPGLASDYGAGRYEQLAARYEKATQVVIYTLTLPVCLFVFFGYDVLRIWVSEDAAERAFLPLAVLAVGFLCNASVSIGYTVALSTGNTRYPLVVNMAAAFVYVPTLYVCILKWGIRGAALTWLLLNVYYLFSLLPLVQRRIMHGSVTVWLARNFYPFIIAGAVAFEIARGASEWWCPEGGEAITWGACLAATIIYGLVGYRSLSPGLREDIAVFSKRAVLLWKPI